MNLPPRQSAALAVSVLLGVALWLRWPGFDFGLWNVDEAIHATAARVLLDGGVMYRDAIDQRTPLTYYAFAGIFALFGENNLWAVRCVVALLITATGFSLFVAARRLQGHAAGIVAGLLFVVSASGVLPAGEANAAHTEWFVAFFTSAAAALFLTGGPAPGAGRLFATGALLGAAFLSKQPALLDAAAPAAALLYAGWRRREPARARLAALAGGWLLPVLITAAGLALRGALRDGVFYAWTYNLDYYAPEVTAAERVVALSHPLRLLAVAQPWLLALWAVAALVTLHRLAQRQPGPAEEPGNPGLVFVAVWSLTALAGAASGGRDFAHYAIPFLAPWCLGAALAFDRVVAWAGRTRRRPGRWAAFILLAVAAGSSVASAVSARHRTVPADASARVSAYIREHSRPGDRIFVWGYHPDIYFLAGRLPASRYLYASFLTGLVPWTNVAPERDTAYAIVPGTMADLLRELTSRPPLYLVDCSAGPNRHWQKYPPEKFPVLQDFIRSRYRLEEPHQFIPQGFRLFRLRESGAASEPEDPLLPPEVANALSIGTLGPPLRPTRASARFGASAAMADGRMELFAHAPASLTYRLPAGITHVRGGLGLKPGAWATDNRDPTDGAEFIIRWRPDGGQPQDIFRRLLRPREEPADRGVTSFRVALPPHRGGELELVTAPYHHPASDWTYWTDLLLENSH